MGSGSWVSGQHLGGPLAAVVRLFARKTVVNDELDSFLAETIGMCSVETGNVVRSPGL